MSEKALKKSNKVYMLQSIITAIILSATHNVYIRKPRVVCNISQESKVPFTR